MLAANSTSAFSSAGKASLLFSLAFAYTSTPLMLRLWRYLQQYAPLLEAMTFCEDSTILKSPTTPPAMLFHHLLSTLYLFCSGSSAHIVSQRRWRERVGDGNEKKLPAGELTDLHVLRNFVEAFTDSSVENVGLTEREDYNFCSVCLD